VKKLLDANGDRTLTSFHRELGLLLWDKCGMARNASGLREALGKIPELRQQFWKSVRVPGEGDSYNQSLERAGRIADFALRVKTDFAALTFYFGIASFFLRRF
jgi:succinate dehydrogenase / fumarate reductase flavoprotein subunit